MFKLILHKPAADDLRDMAAAGGNAQQCAARILAFIQELKGRQDWLNQLLTRNFRNETFNVDKYVEFWDAGLDLWRFALFEVDFTKQTKWQMPYRILYGYDQPCTTFRILGVVSRDFDYDSNHEFTKRVCRTYDELGMPKHRARGTFRRS